MLSHDMRVWRGGCVCKYHKDKDPVNASICERSHRINFMGYILFVTGRGKQEAMQAQTTKMKELGNWNTYTEYLCTEYGYITDQLPGRVAFSTWRRALALVHNRQIWFIISLTIGATKHATLWGLRV